MNTYWKMVASSVALMLVVMGGGLHLWPLSGYGVVACLVAGVIGTKLRPHVPTLRGRLVRIATGSIIFGGVLQAIGLFCQVYALWAVGMVFLLALPLAGFDYDIQCADEEHRKRLRELDAI